MESKFNCELIDKETIEYKGKDHDIGAIINSIKSLYNGDFENLNFGENNKENSYKVNEFAIDTRDYNIPGFKESLEENEFGKLKYENPYIVIILTNKIVIN